MSDTVAQLTSENENVRTRVKELEKLISMPETTLSLTREEAEMNETVHTKATGFKSAEKSAEKDKLKTIPVIFPRHSHLTKSTIGVQVVLAL